MEGEPPQTTVSPPAKGTRWNSWSCGRTGGRSGQPCPGDWTPRGRSGQEGCSDFHAETLTLPLLPVADLVFQRVFPIDTGHVRYKTLFRYKVFCTRVCYRHTGELCRQSWELGSPLKGSSRLFLSGYEILCLATHAKEYKSPLETCPVCLLLLLACLIDAMWMITE